MNDDPNIAAEGEDITIWEYVDQNCRESLKTMTNNILDDLHAARAKLLAAAGDALHRYVEKARQRALSSGHPIAEPVQREERDHHELKDVGGVETASARGNKG